MSEEEKIKVQPADNRPPTTDDREKSAEETSVSSEENKIVAEETQPQTLKPQPSTSKMEVHHHGHVHEKKKWKEYLFQFLMLFLAVFCGFLAEYQLEQTIERHKEKEFIKSMVADVKLDTLKISENIYNKNHRILIIDSLIRYLSSADPNANSRLIYYLARRVTRVNRFQSNNRTIQQLKSSGSMRLIRNQKASDAIMAYNEAVELIYYNQERENQEIMQASLLLRKLLDGNVLETMISGKMMIIPPVGNPQLRSNDKNLILDITYEIHQIKSSLLIIVSRMDNLYILATQTIQLLQKEYNL